MNVSPMTADNNIFYIRAPTLNWIEEPLSSTIYAILEGGSSIQYSEEYLSMVSMAVMFSWAQYMPFHDGLDEQGDSVDSYGIYVKVLNRYFCK